MSFPIERSGILRCRGYQRLESEGWSYTYRAGDEELCFIIDMEVRGSFENFTRIQGFGLVLGNSFDTHATAYPGMTRIVRHSDGEREAFRMQLNCLSPMRFSILIGARVVDVLPAPDGDVFFSDACEIARIRTASQESVPALEKLQSRFAPQTSSTPDGAPFVDAGLRCPLDPMLALAILAFPVLKFAR